MYRDIGVLMSRYLKNLVLTQPDFFWDRIYQHIAAEIGAIIASYDYSLHSKPLLEFAEYIVRSAENAT